MVRGGTSGAVFPFLCPGAEAGGWIHPAPLPPGHPQPCVPSQANKTPLRALDPIRLSGMNCSPDFTPSFANLGRPVMGNRGLVSISSLHPRRSPLPLCDDQAFEPLCLGH